MIFRLLAIEKLSWKFFFRVLVIFRQFFAFKRAPTWLQKSRSGGGGAGTAGAISAPRGPPEASRRPFGRHFAPILAPCSPYVALCFGGFVASARSSFLLPQYCDACFLPAVSGFSSVATGLQL